MGKDDQLCAGILAMNTSLEDCIDGHDVYFRYKGMDMSKTCWKI